MLLSAAITQGALLVSISTRTHPQAQTSEENVL